MNLKGYRTLAVAVILAVGGALETYGQWLSAWIGPHATGAAIFVSGILMAALRIITNGPIGSSSSDPNPPAKAV